jgi:hypothetical protein
MTICVFINSCSSENIVDDGIFGVDEKRLSVDPVGTYLLKRQEDAASSFREESNNPLPLQWRDELEQLHEASAAANGGWAPFHGANPSAAAIYNDKRLPDPVGSYLLRRRVADPVGSYLLKRDKSNANAAAEAETE